ncbi:hypothetical protein G8S49_01515 [Clostridium botulinum C]|uniref:Uncharacterized protein n=1 Tax=Clostridium botulinum C TaxID=36828 RepID=A0A9Q3V8V4_CLOBO|nr:MULTISPECIES: hypothetical protein [Clostridium]MCD3194253.1 hypothetical protein [Clostridium botulinum C]MCD3199118.1 hypothetical protein [Clostridium botulinum C]MCD3204593.1 hypothetical protein [Clostridium botulinum C]MCD3207936.1 hypothetical protein [Clostridium botulinum C]MCD3225124.1 hypothetical protein [Clostridium botulinum C]
MYYLFKTKRLNKPSEYWNLELGDKLVLRAFVEKEIEERTRKELTLQREKIPIFSVDVV